jgi:hypothetical protein
LQRPFDISLLERVSDGRNSRRIPDFLDRGEEGLPDFLAESVEQRVEALARRLGLRHDGSIAHLRKHERLEDIG